MKKKTTHTKMARKIRLTESELIAMIETVITTNTEETTEGVSEVEKKDNIEENVIKLTQKDLQNIIERINKKVEEK